MNRTHATPILVSRQSPYHAVTVLALLPAGLTSEFNYWLNRQNVCPDLLLHDSNAVVIAFLVAVRDGHWGVSEADRLASLEVIRYLHFSGITLPNADACQASQRLSSVDSLQ